MSFEIVIANQLNHFKNLFSFICLQTQIRICSRCSPRIQRPVKLGAVSLCLQAKPLVMNAQHRPTWILASSMVCV